MQMSIKNARELQLIEYVLKLKFDSYLLLII